MPRASSEAGSTRTEQQHPRSGGYVPAAHGRWAPQTSRLTGSHAESRGPGQEEPPPDQAPLPMAAFLMPRRPRGCNQCTPVFPSEELIAIGPHPAR
ncbi:hypothetical protein NDU88_007286 [Pleurodeles waltl]|uniref:Uncharacterized protein n=1 Tax=Pleurodeles waltl TaxID=8319 RepID=A0AAV7UNE0_PLEWA|nr:hypothetical protein NDU88_007286 [Pleurodeles waltl]